MCETPFLDEDHRAFHLGTYIVDHGGVCVENCIPQISHDEELDREAGRTKIDC